MVRSFILAAAASLALGACATDTATSANASTAPPSGDCFSARNINGFAPIDRNHVRLTVGANHYYALTTLSAMHGINFQQSLGVESRSGWVCTGNGLDVMLLVPNAIPERYNVTEVVRLPDEPPVQGS